MTVSYAAAPRGARSDWFCICRPRAGVDCISGCFSMNGDTVRPVAAPMVADRRSRVVSSDASLGDAGVSKRISGARLMAVPAARAEDALGEAASSFLRVSFSTSCQFTELSGELGRSLGAGASPVPGRSGGELARCTSGLSFVREGERARAMASIGSDRVWRERRGTSGNLGRTGTETSL